MGIIISLSYKTTTNIKIQRTIKMKMSVNLLSSLLLLLVFVASIATSTHNYQGNGFAFAEEQTSYNSHKNSHKNNYRNNEKKRQLVRRPDPIEVANASVLQRTKVLQEDETCKEPIEGQKVYITKRKKVGNEIRKTTYELCEWVGKRKNQRCNKLIRKKIRSKDENGRRKITKECYNPRKFCESLCQDVPDNTDSTLPTKMSCPIEEEGMVALLGGKSCAEFPLGQKCHYEKTGVGCTSSTFRCMPFVTCTCRLDNITGRDTWTCASFLPPPDYTCPPPPRGDIPPGWEDPPDGLQQPCELSEDYASTEGDSKIDLRRWRDLRS